jgi:hypothetical protein
MIGLLAILICATITILWIFVYYNHLPMFDRSTKQYVVDEYGVAVANFCIMLMIVLAFIMGKLL